MRQRVKRVEKKELTIIKRDNSFYYSFNELTKIN